MNWSCSGMSWTLIEMIQSCSGLETSSIVNNFSSKNYILSTTNAPARDDRHWLLCSRFSLIAFVGMWNFLRLRDFNPRSIHPMDLELIPKSLDVFHMERRGLQMILFFIFAFSSRVLTLRGRSLRALSYKLPVSLYLWIVRYINFLPTFSLWRIFKISPADFSPWNKPKIFDLFASMPVIFKYL